MNFCPVSSWRRGRTVHHNSGTEVCQHSRRCWPTLSTESAKYFSPSPCSPSLVIFYSLPNHSLGSLDNRMNIWNYPIHYCQIPIWRTVSGSWGHCPDQGNNNDMSKIMVSSQMGPWCPWSPPLASSEDLGRQKVGTNTKYLGKIISHDLPAESLLFCPAFPAFTVFPLQEGTGLPWEKETANLDPAKQIWEATFAINLLAS